MSKELENQIEEDLQDLMINILKKEAPKSEKLIKNHDNEKIKTLALNRLIEIHLKNNNLKKINEIFNENILNKASSKEFLDLIKIKKRYCYKQN